MKRYIRGFALWLLVSVAILPSTALCAAASSALQEGYFQAAAAAKRGDYVVAYCFWRPLAEKGDAEAQYALGWMYHNGYGLVSDDQAARAWWERAIAQGHVESMFSLGTLYSVGSDTIERNYAAAMKLWAHAADAGNKNAKFALRELAERNSVELRPVIRMIQRTYPHLLDDSLSRPEADTKPDTKQSVVMSTEPSATEETKQAYGKGGLIALAAGYPPVMGWAAASLLEAREIALLPLFTY